MQRLLCWVDRGREAVSGGQGSTFGWDVFEPTLCLLKVFPRFFNRVAVLDG
jgi:hypothetical protein